MVKDIADVLEFFKRDGEKRPGRGPSIGKPEIRAEHLAEIGNLSSKYLASEAVEFSEDDLHANLFKLYKMSRQPKARMSKRDIAKIMKIVRGANIIISQDNKSSGIYLIEGGNTGGNKKMSFPKLLQDNIRERLTMDNFRQKANLLEEKAGIFFQALLPLTRAKSTYENNKHLSPEDPIALQDKENGQIIKNNYNPFIQTAYQLCRAERDGKVDLDYLFNNLKMNKHIFNSNYDSAIKFIEYLEIIQSSISSNIKKIEGYNEFQTALEPFLEKINESEKIIADNRK